MSAAAQSLPRPIVRDSSGVRIVEYQTIKTTVPAFKVGTTPLAKVGGVRDDPAEEIEGGPTPAVRLSDGRVAVLEQWTVRILNPSGRLDRVIGGRGGGPGLFSAQLSDVCRIRGDTLVVIATTARRISVFDPKGNHVRSMTAAGAVISTCADDGTLVAYTPMGREAFGAISPQDRATAPTRQVLRRLERDGRFGDSIGVFDGFIGASMQYAIVRGSFVVCLYGGTLYADNGSKPEIKAYSLTGALMSVLRWRDPLTPLTDKLIEQINDFRTPTDAPAGAREASLARFAQVKQRPFLPAYTSFLVDRVGRLWLRDYSRPVRGYKKSGENEGYTVFSPNGTLLGRFDIPRRDGNARVTDAGADYVLIRTGSADEGVGIIVLSIAPAR